MSTRVRADAQLLTHSNPSLTGTAQTVTLPSNTTSLMITNLDASINILVSFDAGATYYTLQATQSLSLDVDRLVSFKIKSASGTPACNCLFASEA